MQFGEFYGKNANYVCAAIGIPPNVAFSEYNDSFSASRAATKDWEHTMNARRNYFQNQFWDPILALWLHSEILSFKIQAPGYLEAVQKKNWVVIAAYLKARFRGPMFPHIDPLKEAKAERVKLGTASDHINLTTVEQSTEFLNGGDSVSNMEQYGEELDFAEEQGIMPAVAPADQVEKDEDEDEDEDGDKK